MQGYWFSRGSSGSPVFVTGGQQLAGVLSLAELGANEGKSRLQEAFLVPATTIRAFVAKRAAMPVAATAGVDPAILQPIIDAFGIQDVPIAEIPARLKQAIDDMRARAAQPVPPSNDGSDIDATIGASRDKLRALDTDGARALLQTKIVEETEARVRRLVPLLKERAAIERLCFDHQAANATLTGLSGLTPDDVWVWIELGDLWRTTGYLPRAAEAYRNAEQAARRTGDERDLSVSHDKIGDVLVAQGDRAGALESYRAGHAIRETLAGRDPGNAEWQRDLSVSHNKIGDVLVAQGERAGALASYRAGLAIRETLADRDPGNTQWQRDLSVSHDRIGDVLVAQGDRAGALASYRAGLAIAETLVGRDPGNTEWQRDLSVSHDRIGNVLMAQGERAGALASYRAGLAIRQTLAGRDPGNTDWQRDLMVSCVKIADADPAAATALLTRALDIATRLDAAGKLAPVDAWIPAMLARRLTELGAAAKPKRPRAAGKRARNDAPAKSP
jgi:predicted negative regulator of RcsB-dependent stress response